MANNLSNIRIEYHILQSFPVTCLNRDDVGAPKTAVVGAVTRARVSSQCWKRQVRMGLREQGVRLAIRTKNKNLEDLLLKACLDVGAEQSVAESCGKHMAGCLADDTLLFITDSESLAFAKYAKEQGFDSAKIKEKDLAKVANKALNPAIDGLDIALFGRMVAKAQDMNVEAAASFSHAISTHRVSNEVEFFTALDDIPDPEKPGAAHMGTLEYSSATYYRYISLDLGQLAEWLNEDDLKNAVGSFTKALFIAVPAARQSTQSGASPWEFARVLVRKGQRLQVPFETPVKSKGGGYLESSIETLQSYLDKKEKLSGSLFGKIADYEWGVKEDFSIDDLVTSLQSHV